MFKTRFAKLFFIVGLFCVTSIGSVFATWMYTSVRPASQSFEIGISMEHFTWDGSEMLPDTVEGENHLWLIENLISGVGMRGDVIGINNSNSELSDLIDKRLDGGWGWKRDYFGSMAVTGGQLVQDLFGTEAAGLSFIIQVVNSTEYYIYTTSVDLGERGEPNIINTSNKTPGKPNIPIGEYIYPIYRTKVTRQNTNTQWNIIETKVGKAKSDWYDENRRNANVTQIPSYDLATWQEGVMGANPNTSEAIWTFVGDDFLAQTSKEMKTVYYRIRPTAARNITIRTANTLAEISILNSGGATIAQSSVVGEEVSVRFAAAANTLYYIAIKGDANMLCYVS